MKSRTDTNKIYYIDALLTRYIFYNKIMAKEIGQWCEAALRRTKNEREMKSNLPPPPFPISFSLHFTRLPPSPLSLSLSLSPLTQP